MTTIRRVLIVDDDDVFAEILQNRIKLHEEFEPIVTDSGTSALKMVDAGNFDLVILDIGLPDLDGREICRMMRRRGFSMPIIMLTGAATDADTILGLDAGADDYIAKPFRMEVLVARMRAQLARN